MGSTSSQSAAVATIAAMITPALLLLGSASLVATVLGRVVDRARVLASIAHDGTPDKIVATTFILRSWLESHAKRARYAERSLTILYAAIVSFVATCLSIGLDRLTSDSLAWLPVTLAIVGTAFLLAGGAYMVAESRLSGAQIDAEIQLALSWLEHKES